MMSRLSRVLGSRPQLRLATLVAIMGSTTLVATTVTLLVGYRAHEAEERGRLIEIVQSRARLMEAVARFNALYSTDFPGGTQAATVSQVRDAHRNFSGFGETGEFTLARLNGDRMEFVLHQRRTGLVSTASVPFTGLLAEPMREALSGHSGAMTGLDHAGARVLAAFEPVAVLDMGVVAKIDLAEVRRPFIQAATIAGGIGLTLVLVATWLVTRVSEPFTHALETSERRLQFALTAASDGFLDWPDTSRDRQWWSPGFYRVLGLPVGSVVPTHRHVMARVHPDDAPALEHVPASVCEGERTDRLVRFMTASEQYRWFRVRVATERDRETGIVSAATAITDVHDDVVAPQRIAALERRHLALVNAIPEGVIVANHRGIIQSANPRARSMFGYEREGLAGRELRCLVPEDLRPAHDLAFARAVDTGTLQREHPFETNALRCDGRTFPCGVSLGLWREDEALLFGAIVSDLTEQKRHETRLEETETRNRAMLDAMLDAIAEIDADGTICDFVAGRQFQLVAPIAELVGIRVSQALPTAAATVVMEAVAAALSTRDVQQCEYEIERPDCERLSREMRVVPWRESAVLAFIRDVTSERRLTRSLKATDEARRFAEAAAIEIRKIVEALQAEVYLCDAETLTFVMVSRGCVDNLGYGADALLAMTPLDLLSEFDAQSLADLLEPLRARRDKTLPFQTQHRRRNGSCYPVEARFELMELNGRATFVALVRDLSETIDRDRRLTLLAAAVDQTADGVLITRLDGTIEYVNAAVERMTGFAAIELLGQTPAVLKSSRQDVDFYEDMWRTISDGQVWSGTLVNRRKDGTEYDERMTITPVRNADGEVFRFVAVKHDVTEDLALRTQLQHAQRMEGVGRLAGGIAHDFNNLLTGIMGYSFEVLDQVPDEGRAAKDLRQVLALAKRAAALTRQLLTFSRQRRTELTVVDVNRVVEDVGAVVRRLIGEDLAFEVVLSASPIFCRVDAGLIAQVLINLAINSRDAMPTGGSLRFELARVTLGQSRVDRYCALRAGEYAVLRVTDTGCGMNETTLTHLFEPFFTTKEVGKGTGLGLSTVYGIVEQHQGGIDVESREEQGTTFTVFLPTSPPVSAASQPTADRTPRGGSETVLVVEDESSIRLLAVRTLERLGYRVLATEGPDHVAALLAEFVGRVDLLLADVVLPGMSGPELWKQLLIERPALKVLFMSGYTDIATQLRTSFPFMDKPFTSEELARQVRSVLDDNSSRADHDTVP